MHREQFYKEASVYKRVKQNRIALLRGLLLSIKFRFFLVIFLNVDPFEFNPHCCFNRFQNVEDYLQ